MNLHLIPSYLFSFFNWAKRALLPLTIFIASPALAQVHICNQMAEEEAYIAIGYQSSKDWVSEGWFLARPGRCYSFRSKVKGDHLYYFAYSKTKKETWQGKTPFCVSVKPFKIRFKSPADLDCAAQEATKENFVQVGLDGYKVTEVYLSPNNGPKIDAVPYERADMPTLSLWASEGDKTAAQVIRSRSVGP